MKKLTLLGLPVILAIAVLIIMLTAIPAQSRPSLGVTNFDSVHLRDTGPTAQPVLRADQLGTGKIVEFLDSGTPVWGINDGGTVTVGGVTQSGPIRFGTATNVVSGTTIAHGLGTTPTVALLTAQHTPALTQVVYIISTGSVSITVGLVQETAGITIVNTVHWLAGK